MPSHHCRCRTCRARRKLPKHPDEYLRQPKCANCGARSWLRDDYRHRIELPQMRAKTGRYKTCHADCFHHPHRAGSTGCKFDKDFNYRDN